MYVIIWKDTIVGKFSSVRAAVRWAEKEMEIPQGDYELRPMNEPLKKAEFVRVYK